VTWLDELWQAGSSAIEAMIELGMPLLEAIKGTEIN
jgi:hypothetical protein